MIGCVRVDEGARNHFFVMGELKKLSLMPMGRHPNILGLKSLQTAKKVIVGIEVMHMIKKGQTLQGEMILSP
ncbi:hypothetical protein AAIE21_13870 [Paenibacillus sp. 102]|uniref:hypothetical protein n=1 Tax=Paenibacillus sp. 102 TaxID=3120823 RepID=UPI0031BB52C3